MKRLSLNRIVDADNFEKSEVLFSTEPGFAVHQIDISEVDLGQRFYFDLKGFQQNLF